MSVSPGSFDIPDLASFLKRIGPSVEARLRARFGSALNRQDIEDVLARALFTFWRRREIDADHETRDEVRFYVIARSAALDLLRARRREVRTVSLTDDIGEKKLSEPSSPPENERLCRDLSAILDTLSEVDRDIIFNAVNAPDFWTELLAASSKLSANALRVRKSRILSWVKDRLIEKGHRPEPTSEPVKPFNDEPG